MLPNWKESLHDGCGRLKDGLVTQPIIFISYSHKDDKEKEELLSHLKVLQKASLFEVWSDDKIEGGADWEQEISRAIVRSNVVILLISKNFLTSDFILNQEIPAILKRHYNEDLPVFPIIAKECAWKKIDWLKKMNVRPKNGRPIWGDGGKYVDEDLTTITEEISGIITSKISQKISQIQNFDHHTTNEKKPTANGNLTPSGDRSKESEKAITLCPYRGLSAFQEKDADYFYGREQTTKKLCQMVDKKPLTTVLGSSGSGKSSLVFAGLIPQLKKQQKWVISTFRPGDRPFYALAAGLMPLLDNRLDEIDLLEKTRKLADALKDGKIELRDVFENIHKKQCDQNMLLISDQFEELYTLCQDTREREIFLEELLKAIKNPGTGLNSSFKVVIAFLAIGQTWRRDRGYASSGNSV
jgi:hypothetical protein